jgi:hypothetical protein
MSELNSGRTLNESAIRKVSPLPGRSSRKNLAELPDDVKIRVNSEGKLVIHTTMPVSVTSTEKIEAHSCKDILAHTDGAVRKLRPVTCSSTITEEVNKPSVGDVMEDGTIFAGMSPVDGKALYVLPSRINGSMAWDVANKHLSGLNVCGHNDWRLGTPREVEEIYEHRNEGGLKKLFNHLGRETKFWTSEQKEFDFNGRNVPYCGVYLFSDKDEGGYTMIRREDKARLLAVRTGPAPE